MLSIHLSICSARIGIAFCFGILKAWSAPSNFIKVADGKEAITPSIRSNSARASLVPCRNSIGILILWRWSARSIDGLPAGWSGNPTKIIPLTLGDSWLDKYWDVILPPKDFPPANIGSSGKSSVTLATAASTTLWATGGKSGRLFRCSIYKKL